MMYLVKSGKVYVTVEPVLNIESERQYPVCFAWTYARGEAVRFPSQWHANAVADALPNGGEVIEVKS